MQAETVKAYGFFLTVVAWVAAFVGSVAFAAHLLPFEVWWSWPLFVLALPVAIIVADIASRLTGIVYRFLWVRK
jgi:fatty acid desaturase